MSKIIDIDTGARFRELERMCELVEDKPLAASLMAAIIELVEVSKGVRMNPETLTYESWEWNPETLTFDKVEK